MNNRGQGAMEYLMTYGWAILVVIIVGIVLWQSGVFGTGSGGVSGFDKVRIEDYSWSVANGWSVSLENAAGQTMKNVNITYAGDLTAVGTGNENWAPGKEYSNTTATVCATEGAGYAIDMTISYNSEAAIAHTETGTIRGTCEA